MWWAGVDAEILGGGNVQVSGRDDIQCKVTGQDVEKAEAGEIVAVVAQFRKGRVQQMVHGVPHMAPRKRKWKG